MRLQQNLARLLTHQATLKPFCFPLLALHHQGYNIEFQTWAKILLLQKWFHEKIATWWKFREIDMNSFLLQIWHFDERLFTISWYILIYQLFVYNLKVWWRHIMMICACILLSGGSQPNSGYGVTDVSALNKPKTKKNQSMNEPPHVQGNTLMRRFSRRTNCSRSI